MTTSDYSPSGIRVSLHNADLWSKFYPRNEMVVKKDGRKLFPDLDVNIEGLIPDSLYTVSLFLERIDDHKYTFFKATGQWEEAGKSNKILPVDKKQHKDGGMAGAHWMKRPVSFSYVHMTNDPDYKKKSAIDDMILVSSLHKYQPVITVRRLSDGMEEEFRLTMTEFMVVTVYQDREIAELKKASNKYAFRKPRGKKRAIAFGPGPTAPPTGPASLSINIVTPPVGSPISSPAKKMAPPTPAPIHHQNQMRVSPAMVPKSVGSNNFQIQMKTLPATFPSPVEPNSSKKQIKAEPASPPSTPPPAMVTSSTVQAGHRSLLKTSSAPSPTPPAVVQPYGAPNHSQNQTMPLPTMVPPCMGLNNFQNPIIMAPLFIVAHPGQIFAMNQHWNPYGMWNTHQIGGGAPVPQPPQWNMIQGAAPFGQPGFPQFNGAGPSSQQGPNGANFFLRY